MGSGRREMSREGRFWITCASRSSRACGTRAGCPSGLSCRPLATGSWGAQASSPVRLHAGARSRRPARDRSVLRPRCWVKGALGGPLGVRCTRGKFSRIETRDFPSSGGGWTSSRGSSRWGSLGDLVGVLCPGRETRRVAWAVSVVGGFGEDDVLVLGARASSTFMGFPPLMGYRLVRHGDIVSWVL